LILGQPAEALTMMAEQMTGQIRKILNLSKVILTQLTSPFGTNPVTLRANLFPYGKKFARAASHGRFPKKMSWNGTGG
jgi:hypothetical protein